MLWGFVWLGGICLFCCFRVFPSKGTRGPAAERFSQLCVLSYHLLSSWQYHIYLSLNQTICPSNMEPQENSISAEKRAQVTLLACYQMSPHLYLDSATSVWTEGEVLLARARGELERYCTHRELLQACEGNQHFSALGRPVWSPLTTANTSRVQMHSTAHWRTPNKFTHQCPRAQSNLVVSR